MAGRDGWHERWEHLWSWGQTAKPQHCHQLAEAFLDLRLQVRGAGQPQPSMHALVSQNCSCHYSRQTSQYQNCCHLHFHKSATFNEWRVLYKLYGND